MTSAFRQSGPKTRLHGRIARDGQCEIPGCSEPGEFRAPTRGARRTGDGPGGWRWLCLDHVRQHNSSYDYFAGMNAEEIFAAQSPLAGWDSEVRAFRAAGSADLPPRWADFADPADAIGARFRQRTAGAGAAASAAMQSQPGARFTAAEQRALAVMGLDNATDRKALRGRYAALLRRYHPDRNGGDRSHEAALQAVVEAYQTLRRALG